MTPLPRAWILLAGFWLVLSAARAHEPVVEMLAAVQAFTGALTPAQKTELAFPFEDRERENWNYVPLSRHGLSLKAMTEPQRPLALALLRSGLSQRGFARAEAIIALENVLREIEQSGHRDPTLYFVTVFGTPGSKSSWGWRFEGHHLSLNFTITGGEHVAVTPSFLGSNPAEVRAGPQKGLRILADEDDLGRAFALSLDPAQRKVAILPGRAPSEIITSNKARVDPLFPAGLPAAQMKADQREKFIALIQVYLTRYRPELADVAWARITAAGIDQVCFAWAGGFEPGQGHYYRIQGPTFLVEFDNTQNNANHIHTAWRDFAGDFGRDTLAEHYAKDHR